MPRQQARSHFLSRNHRCWTPPVVIVADSETIEHEHGADRIQVLRCWSASVTRRRSRNRAGEVSSSGGTEQEDFALTVDKWACEDKTAWLFAHNVAFDLVTTRLPAQLAALGWELSSRHAVTGGSPWLVLHKGKRITYERDSRNPKAAPVQKVRWQHTLTVADSFSLMPVPLATLSDATGIAKPQLPRDSDTLDTWMARCDADVAILRRSLLDLMDWWEASDMGNWSVSGAANAWNSYRHSVEEHDVVIDLDPDALAVEHHVCYGGRRETFRVGTLQDGQYAELDFKSAYPTIAARYNLPRKRMGKLSPGVIKAIMSGSTAYDMIANVTMSTDKALYPVRTDKGVFYPVGTFTTTLAGPEIRDAQRRGHLKSVDSGYFYSMAPHMQAWARKMLDLQATEDGSIPESVRIWAKAASRSGCGKWAQRSWRTEEWCGPPCDDWTYYDVAIAGSDSSASVCGLNGVYYLSVGDQDGDHEFPAVLAFIESHVRVRLNAVIDNCPESSVIQCDTDGIMVNIPVFLARWAGAARRGMTVHNSAGLIDKAEADLSDTAYPLSIRVKRVFGQAVMYGPQHVVIDGKPRFAGVPASAWQTGENSWAARLWPGLSWQISNSVPGEYKRPAQAYLVTGPYARGWVTASGRVLPVEVRAAGAAGLAVAAWKTTRYARLGTQLAAVQSAWAAGLWPGQPGTGSDTER